MKKKYHSTGAVIFGIFIAALLAVAVVTVLIYQSGLQYIKTDAGAKYFGNVNNKNLYVNGRMWFQDTTASIQAQKFYIVEIKSDSLIEPLRISNINSEDDVFEVINNALPENLTDSFPMNNFIFSSPDDTIFFHRDTFDSMIKKYESDKNYIKSGEIYTIDGAKWVLTSTKTNPVSYKDFEISHESDKNRIYKGDILKFTGDENISFASFILANGNVINLYPAYNIYRIYYEKGRNAGDLYIGMTNSDFEKNGRGIYYYTKTGLIYYGDFVKNEKTGYCEFLLSDGDSYMGDIVESQRRGEGVYRWSDGTIYTGNFDNDMKNGYGVNIFADGSSYAGYYVNDVKEGEGKYTWANGDIYEGKFKNDLYEGEGKFTWANGEYYKGNFMYNAVHGEGTYYWTSGRTYKGYWDRGKMSREKPTDVLNNSANTNTESSGDVEDISKDIGEVSE